MARVKGILSSIPLSRMRERARVRVLHVPLLLPSPSRGLGYYFNRLREVASRISLARLRERASVKAMARLGIVVGALLYTWTAGAVILAGGLLTISFSFFAAGGTGMTLSGGVTSLIHSIGPLSVTAMEGGSLKLIPGIVGTSPTAAMDLGGAHAFPTPFKPSFGHDRITFRGMTPSATVRIYTISGELVRELTKHDPLSNDLVWFPVTNTSGQPVASGVYLYAIQGDTGKNTGKLMIIR
ncbi:MAG: T9SS type A sorting domain-containing protein [Proteobacteria bacterium]|nr:T9SS type A sorting domain-containing protein [Pseudomonadota bacterium]